MKTNLVISCEHGGNFIPKFALREILIPVSVLKSHKGYDKGALEISRIFADRFASDAVINKVSRLALDYNRSLSNRDVWSKYSVRASDSVKSKLVDEYKEYRAAVQKKLKKGSIHLSVHSFTPVKNGVKRNCDFAVLYDPARKNEKLIAQMIKAELGLKKIRCRLNYPYRGTSDGLTKHFRNILGKDYTGLELEFNQRIVDDKEIVSRIVDSVYEVIYRFGVV